MPRKKNPNNNYFNHDVENAIHAFNKTTDDKKRNELFTIIYPALAKVAQVWRNKIKPVYIQLPPDELEMDCITFMLEKLPMVKEGKGKAFSYLTVTARNYYIQENMKAYSKKLKGYSIETMPENFDVAEIISDRVDEMEWNANLFYTFVEYVEQNFDNLFVSAQQKTFGEHFIKKIKHNVLIHDFNRRDMLNELACESGIERGLITKHVSRVVSQFSLFKEYYEIYGEKPLFKEKIHLTEEDKEYIRNNYQHYSKHNGLQGISRKLGVEYNVVRKYIKNL